MNKFYIECLLYGFITLFIGKTIINILFHYNKNELNEFFLLYKKINKYFIIEITLFCIGIILFLLFEYIQINKWYCEKVCADDKCHIVCKIPIK